MSRTVVCTFSAFVALLAACEAASLDAQMATLCEQDGGVRVLERVRVPPEELDQYGGPRRQVLMQNTADGSVVTFFNGEYSKEHTSVAIKDGDPFKGMISEGRLLRHQTIIRRTADGKVLGTQITYSRTGGDIALGHPSQNHCPKPRPIAVTQSVFYAQ